MKKIVFAIGLCFLVFMSKVSLGQENISNTNKITFDEALDLSNRNSYILKQANNKTLEKEQNLKAARGLFLPNVSLNASYVVMSDDLSLDLNPVKNAITPIYEALGNYGDFSGVPYINPETGNPVINPATGEPVILNDAQSTQAVRQQLLYGADEIGSQNWEQTIQKKQFGYVSAGFTQPIFTGGKILAANNAAKIKLDEAKLENKQKQFELVDELVSRYYGLVLAKNAEKIRAEVNSTMHEHLNDAEKLMDEGMIAKAEFLHAKVYSSQANRELKKAQRQVDIVNDALINTMAIDTNMGVEPMSMLFYLEKLEPKSYFLDKALINSPLLQKIEKKKNLAYQGYKIEKAEIYPKIAAMGTYDIMNHDLSHFVPDYLVGVTMKWNIFNGTSTSRKIKAAKLKQNQVDNFYYKAESDINTAITKYYNEINMYLEQLHELESALEFADEYNRVREKAFKEGMATSTEVSDANLALAKVKIERLQVIYKYDVSLSKLLYFSGISNEFVNYQKSNKAKYENY